MRNILRMDQAKNLEVGHHGVRKDLRKGIILWLSWYDNKLCVIYFGLLTAELDTSACYYF